MNLLTPTTHIILLLIFCFTRSEDIKMYAGGSPTTSANLKTLSFFPDFREPRTLIQDTFICSISDDCEKDRTISYKNRYGQVEYQYFIGNVNLNFWEDRLTQNTAFNYVTASQEDLKMNILGLSRDSEFLINYFSQSTRNSELLRLSFRGKEGEVTAANPYLLKQAKPFAFYKDGRNQENFYLDVKLRVVENKPEQVILLDERIRLCPFSNPALTNWNSVFFSGAKDKIDRYREFFKGKIADLEAYSISLVHSPSNFVMKLNSAFEKMDGDSVFKLGFADSEECDLYFGFEFVRFFKMDFLIGFEADRSKVNLYFQTVSEAPKPFGFWILGLGVFIIAVFLIYVFRSQYSLMLGEKEKRRSELEENLKNV